MKKTMPLRKVRLYTVMITVIVISSFFYLPSHVEAETTTTIAENTGEVTSVALSPSGEPRILYYDVTESTVNYASKTGDSWDKESIEEVGEEGSDISSGMYDVSLSVDSEGTPHVSYHDFSEEVMKYAKKEEGSWDIKAFEQSAEYMDLALDNRDRPHVSYIGEGLEYTRWDSSSWINTTVDEEGMIMQYNSIDVDAEGTPHISYCDHAGDVTLKYATKQGDSWSTEEVDSGGGMYSSIQVDKEDRPHISYSEYGQDTSELKYAFKEEDQWNLETALDSGCASQISFALDSEDKPHVCYYSTSLDFRYTTKKDGKWTVGTVDSEGYVGMYPSIALDDNGDAHMSYYDFSDENLKYARTSGVEDLNDEGSDKGFLASYWWLLLILIISGVSIAIAVAISKKR
ncbi:MAG: hypothetical protein KGY76_07460 [Candidatus Thermoplasmatota archaeon]|nr:hypothetical protein [Candidatus Thermoplasmatota archaeon]